MAGASLPVHGASKNPVTKVVELIEELKQKIIADGKAEENMYKKMACFCETTTENKAKEIGDAKDLLAELSQAMNENKGNIATLAADINELMMDIAKNEAKQYMETTKRERQNADYMQNKAELMNAITSLDKGVQILSGVNQLSLLQGKASSKERTAVAAVKSAQKAVVKAVMRLGERGDKIPVAQLSALEKFGTSSKYTPFEPTITGILTDLLDSFRATAETETTNEAECQTSYESIMQTKSTELKEKKTMLGEKETAKAQQTQELTANQMTWQSTADQMSAANALFAAAKEACTVKADQWTARKEARREELKGIDAALKILTSDEARAKINKAANDGPGTLDFIQVGSVSSTTKKAVSQAYEAMKRAAKKANSMRLSKLAEKVLVVSKEGQTEDPHGDWKVGVIKEINKLLEDLEVEQQVDTETYDNCKEEEHKLQLEIDNRTHTIKRYNVKLDQLDSKVEALQKEIVEASEDVADIIAMQEKATEQRNSENREFSGEKEDDEAAVGILTDAKAELSKFYVKESAAAFVQASEHPTKRLAKDAGNAAEGSDDASDDDIFLQVGSENQGKSGTLLARRAGKKDPVFEVTGNDMVKQMNEHSFSDTDKRGTAGRGIISLIDVIIEDLESDVRKSVAIEEEAESNYQTLMKDSNKEKTDLNNKIDDFRDEKATLESEIDDNKTWKSEEESELDSANKEMMTLLSDGDEAKDILSPCIFMMKEYHSRRTRRNSEVEGLKEGIDFLNGMQA